MGIEKTGRKLSSKDDQRIRKFEFTSSVTMPTSGGPMPHHSPRIAGPNTPPVASIQILGLRWIFVAIKCRMLLLSVILYSSVSEVIFRYMHRRKSVPCEFADLSTIRVEIPTVQSGNIITDVSKAIFSGVELLCREG